MNSLLLDTDALYVIEFPFTSIDLCGERATVNVAERNAEIKQLMLGSCADCGKPPKDYPREVGTTKNKINLNILQTCKCGGTIVRPKRADVVAKYGLSSQRISMIITDFKKAPKYTPKADLPPAWFEVGLGGAGYDTLLAYDWEKEDIPTLGFDPDSFMQLVRSVEVIGRGRNQQADLRFPDEASALNAFKVMDFVYYLVWGTEYEWGDGESPGVRAIGAAKTKIDKKIRDAAKAKRKGSK